MNLNICIRMRSNIRNILKFPFYKNNNFLQKHYHDNGKIPELTEFRFDVKRRPYSNLEDKDVNHFEKLIGSSYVVTDPDELQGYNVDFLRAVRGNSQIVLKPKTTEEISSILKYCNTRKLAVCPQGGNTGLVGGSVPVFDEIILSLQRLNKIESIDEMTGILICESGCILENLENEAKKIGLTVPIDLGAKSSCHIGGNISTNAGGLRLVRYGNLHGSVLGLEAVLANGDIMNLMSNFKKDNTGYHLKHLFIGSEGTLGVITKAAIHCPPLSRSVHVSFIGLPSFDAVLNTFLRAKRDLGEILSSCEMIDEKAFICSINTYKLNAPIQGHPFYMLIETSGSNPNHDYEKINTFLEKSMEAGDISDGTVTNEPSKIQDIWKIRELVPTSLINDGYCFKYDISLPLRKFYDIVPATEERVGNLATRVCGYGHLGDSNLHLNVSCERFTQEIYHRIEPFVYEFTSQLNGSVSAEHGIGFLKTKYLKFSKSPEAIELMKKLKENLDPNNILNPYKVLN